MRDLQLHPAGGDRAVDGEAELALRLEPIGREIVARVAQVAQHVEEVCPDEMAQHESIVQRGAPADEPALQRFAPEPGRERAYQQLLGKAHLGIRRHLEAAELDEAQPPGWPVGREELVDAELGAVRVAGHVDEQVAEQAIDHPRRGRRGAAGRRHLRQRHLQLVEPVMARLVDPRRLARRADEQAGEQVGRATGAAASRAPSS